MCLFYLCALVEKTKHSLLEHLIMPVVGSEVAEYSNWLVCFGLIVSRLVTITLSYILSDTGKVQKLEIAVREGQRSDSRHTLSGYS